jgi:hypothetical protein
MWYRYWAPVPRAPWSYVWITDLAVLRAVERSYPERSEKDPQERSCRRCPKHSEHYEIALWFRELASAGEWGQFRLMALVKFFGVDYRIANLAGIALGTLVNFTAGELWIFRAGRRGVSED